MRRLLALALIGGLLAAASPSNAHRPARTVHVTVLAINDFHGNLIPPSGGIVVGDPRDPSGKTSVAAGGSEYMGTLIHQLRAKNRNTIFVSAGDVIGASPLLSALFHDEPTVESLSLMGLEVSTVGNHEFDEGPAELSRIQNGGCHPKDGCKGPHRFAGARFRYLAANVVQKASGKTLFPAYYVKSFGGVPVAFIGIALQGTPDIVSPSATEGLEFQDEAASVNALVPKLRARGVEAIVVLIHDGDAQTGDYNDCRAMSGALVDIVPKLDKAVDVVVSGHTHQAYNCTIDGRLVTSANRYGTLVTDIDLSLDVKTHDVVSAKAENLIVRDDRYARDPGQTALLASYQAIAGPLANRKVGAITQSLKRDPDPTGESPLGELLASAQLAATSSPQRGGAQIAFLNAGSVRAEIVRRASGEVTYADLFEAQPFGNSLVTLTLTGAQPRTLLEQQWSNPSAPRMLQVSDGFSYSWDALRPPGQKVLADSITLNGKPVDPQGVYRVTVTDYLADGGDGLAVLKEGADRVAAMPDIEATEAYLQAHSPVSPPALDRVHRAN